MKLNHYVMEDVLDSLIDYRGKTPQKSDDGIPTLSAKSVKNGYIDYSECYYISPEEYKRFMVRGFPKVGDILLTTEAPMGLVARLDREDVAIAQRLITLRGKEGILDNDFLLYYLQSPLGQHKLAERETGSTVTGIKQAAFRKIEIDIPEIDIQKKISACLSCLDAKIETNKQINRNLQEQINTLYQAWFVEFIPFSKGEFITSEIGEIPKGWKLEKLGDLCDSVSVKHCFEKEKLIFLNTGDVEAGEFLHSNYSDVDKMPGQAKKSIRQNDILYSEIRPINRHYAFVNFEADDYVVSTKLMVIRSKGINPRRLYQYLTDQHIINELQIEAEARSGTFPQIRFENISQLKMLIATDEVERKFAEIVSKFYAQIDKNVAENNALIMLRNSILPRLMSGELDVSDIDI